MSIRIPLALIACAALVAGCGSSSSSSSSSAPAQSTPAASSSAASGGGVTVTMQNIAFSPTSVTVKKGETVKWVNKDTVAHNVTATKGATFKSSTFGQGGSFTWKAAKAGTVEYFCSIHPNMTAKLIVQ